MLNKIITLCFCGLSFSFLLVTAQSQPDANHLNLLLLQIPSRNTLGCPLNDHQCILRLLKGQNFSKSDGDIASRQFFINPFYNSLIKVSVDDNNNETGNPNASTSGNDTYPNHDFTGCGTYPACSITRLSDYLWSYTCDHALVSFAVAMGVVLCIIIIFSNLIIIVVTSRTKALRKPHGYFKLSLAASDLIAGLLVLPSILYFTLAKIDFVTHVYSSQNFLEIASGVDESYSLAGVIFGVAGFLTTITGIYSLLLLSIDSFLSVRWPLEYRIGDLVTAKRAVSAVLFVWVVALCVSFLPLLAKDYVSYGLVFYTYQYIPIVRPLPDSTVDTPIGYKYSHAIVYLVLVWGVPFVATWILTVLTSVQSRKMLKNMKESRRRSVRSAKALNKVDRELIRTVAIILSIFTFTIIPIAVVMASLLFNPSEHCYSSATSIAFFITTYIFICGRFLNVIVYNVFNKDFREACAVFFVGVVHFIFCYDEIDERLPKTSVSEKKSSSFWSSNKTNGKRGTNETGLTINTASTSADHKGLLSPGLDTTTSKLSVSSATDVARSPNGQEDRKNSVFK